MSSFSPSSPYFSTRATAGSVSSCFNCARQAIYVAGPRRVCRGTASALPGSSTGVRHSSLLTFTTGGRLQGFTRISADANDSRNLKGSYEDSMDAEDPGTAPESPSFATSYLKAAVKLLGVGMVATLLLGVYSTDGWTLRTLAALTGGGLFAAYGYLRKSLSLSGALAAAVVGGVTLCSSFRCTAVLLAFFFASSAITKIGEEKKDIDEEHKAGGQRDWRQVLCNGGVPTLLAAALCWLSGGADLPLGMAGAPAATTWLAAAYIGYYACCCGDTWASELGVLSSTPPRLITTFETVRPGTNGGVSTLGLLASVAGGCFVGLCFALASWIAGASIGAPTHPSISPGQSCVIVALGAAGGLFGSLLDSVLGATIQFTGLNLDTNKITGKRGNNVQHISGLPILDNNAVNLVSACCTAATIGAVSSLCYV